MRLIYNIGIQFYLLLIRFSSLFNNKARFWIEGRKNWAQLLKQKIIPESKYIWIHCASLGEFEQGRPVIEEIKKTMPDFRIALTFFSPSGYEIRKNYKSADIVCYLPADTISDAELFISILNPLFVIFVKYEFWNNYISALYRKKIPLYLISAIFRPGQHFFRFYGSFFLDMLKKFRHIFVQDEISAELLGRAGVTNVTVTGDTRFDRVGQIAGQAKDIPQLEMFRGNEFLFIAGSSWHKDEEIIARYVNKYPDRMKWVFAPHEIDKSNIERLEGLINTNVVRFSEFTEKQADARVLIIDNIGMLSSAYRYAYIAAVGGGFGKGIHNVLEPACWGIPVVFGPKHKKFREAVDLIKLGGARTFNTFNDFSGIINDWLSNKEGYSRSAESAARYIKKNSGATKQVIGEIRRQISDRSHLKEIEDFNL